MCNASSFVRFSNIHKSVEIECRAKSHDA